MVTGESTDNDGDGRDNNRPSSFRYTERFEVECGYYLSIGMTYHDYWDGDAAMVKFYRDKHKRDLDRQNFNHWMQGMYIYEALVDASPVFNPLSEKHEPLQECLIKIDAWISSRGLKLSPKKTQLFKVTQGIKFLGFRFRLTKTGKVVMTLLPEKLSHERRKLRKLVERAKQGYMTKEEVDRCYESWKAHVGNESSKKRKSPGRRARRNCHNLIICMDQYYKNLWRESKCLDLSVQENSL